ncbi:Serine/threonine-protein kinase TIO [Hondaea fermentalgiana]|uniref:non-specific serine/threonine protein kinase n=1 Tax=Hondaea fermentalgiana TaxID=2315210 RepID=A0A2R5GVQ9_9STRA|nr:Serine/threonine-protein kinase TIO [Hondaea fermentalgiana]|eukprot:GBG32004.1 Serine/threonine-protein kinase TIO [Hondaea fermentalgiana]
MARRRAEEEEAEGGEAQAEGGGGAMSRSGEAAGEDDGDETSRRHRERELERELEREARRRRGQRRDAEEGEAHAQVQAEDLDEIASPRKHREREADAESGQRESGQVEVDNDEEQRSDPEHSEPDAKEASAAADAPSLSKRNGDDRAQETWHDGDSQMEPNGQNSTRRHRQWTPRRGRRRPEEVIVPATDAENPMDNYVVLDIIGEGSFGKVHKGRRRFTGHILALKFISKHGKSEAELAKLRSEIEILRPLDHANIVLLLDAFETRREFCVVTEFAQGDLFQLLEDDRRVAEPQVQNIAKQLVQALYYLHSHRIIHRDMKPQNILISSEGRVKLCDFGFARALSAKTIMVTSIKGTPLYMAPELVREQPYNHTADLWSLGVILYELFVGQPPFFTNNIYTLINLIVKNEVRYPSEMSQLFRSFLAGLLTKDSRHRLQWPKLFDHPFVRETPEEVQAREVVEANHLNNPRYRLEQFLGTRQPTVPPTPTMTSPVRMSEPRSPRWPNPSSAERQRQRQLQQRLDVSDQHDLLSIASSRDEAPSPRLRRRNSIANVDQDSRTAPERPPVDGELIPYERGVPSPAARLPKRTQRGHRRSSSSNAALLRPTEEHPHDVVSSNGGTTRYKQASDVRRRATASPPSSSSPTASSSSLPSSPSSSPGGAGIQESEDADASRHPRKDAAQPTPGSFGAKMTNVEPGKDEHDSNSTSSNTSDPQHDLARLAARAAGTGESSLAMRHDVRVLEQICATLANERAGAEMVRNALKTIILLAAKPVERLGASARGDVLLDSDLFAVLVRFCKQELRRRSRRTAPLLADALHALRCLLREHMREQEPLRVDKRIGELCVRALSPAVEAFQTVQGAQTDAIKCVLLICSFCTVYSPRLWISVHKEVSSEDFCNALVVVLQHSNVKRRGSVDQRNKEARLALRAMALLVHPAASNGGEVALEHFPLFAPFDERDEFEVDPSDWFGGIFQTDRPAKLEDRARQADAILASGERLRQRIVTAIESAGAVFDILVAAAVSFDGGNTSPAPLSGVAGALHAKDALRVLLHACSFSVDVAYRLAKDAQALQGIMTLARQSKEEGQLACVLLSVLSRRRLLTVAMSSASIELCINVLSDTRTPNEALPAKASLLAAVLNRFSLEFKAFEGSLISETSQRSRAGSLSKLHHVTTKLLEHLIRSQDLRRGIHALMAACEGSAHARVVHPMQGVGFVFQEFSAHDLPSTLLLAFLKLARRSALPDYAARVSQSILESGLWHHLMELVVPQTSVADREFGTATTGRAAANLSTRGVLSVLQLTTELVSADPPSNASVLFGSDGALYWVVDLLHSTHLQRLLVWPATLGGGAHGIVAVLDHVFDVLALVFACELQAPEQRQLQMVLSNCGFMRKSMRALALVERLGLAADRPEFSLAPLKLHAILVSESELFARQFVEFGGLQQVKELGLLDLARYVRMYRNSTTASTSALKDTNEQEHDKDESSLALQTSNPRGPLSPRKGEPGSIMPESKTSASIDSSNGTGVILQVRMDMTIHALLLLNQLASQGDAYHQAILAADYSADLHYLLGYPNAIVRSETCRLFGKLCKNSSLFYPALARSFSSGPTLAKNNPSGSKAEKGDNNDVDQTELLAASSSSFSPPAASSPPQATSSSTSSASTSSSTPATTLLGRLVACCQDEDPETRKLACFAVGNAAYHSDYLYKLLAPAVPLLVHLLSDREKKTRANAAGALGNLVRNSSVLSAALLDADAHVNLLWLVARDPAIQPQRMALFSMGNLLAHKDCREALLAACAKDAVPLEEWLEDLEKSASDQILCSYASRALAKLRAAPRSPPTRPASISA